MIEYCMACGCSHVRGACTVSTLKEVPTPPWIVTEYDDIQKMADQSNDCNCENVLASELRQGLRGYIHIACRRYLPTPRIDEPAPNPFPRKRRITIDFEARGEKLDLADIIELIGDSGADHINLKIEEIHFG